MLSEKNVYLKLSFDYYKSEAPLGSFLGPWLFVRNFGHMNKSFFDIIYTHSTWSP